MTTADAILEDMEREILAAVVRARRRLAELGEEAPRVSPPAAADSGQAIRLRFVQAMNEARARRQAELG